jgi:uncharacterized membrane protein
MQRNDVRLETRLGWILRAGVIASSVTLVAGLILSFTPAPAFVGAGLLRAGLVMLIATPIARVAASAISYVLSGDWLFVGLTGIVLVELGAAVIAALQGRH